LKNKLIDLMSSDKFDNLYTPEIAVRPLLKNFPISKSRVVWECTDYGKSNISAVLRTEGWTVVGSDLTTGFDFLSDTPTFKFDAIITNPPYSLKDEFIERCYEYKVPFALLLPLAALAGMKRNKMYKHFGINVVILNKRLDFTGKGANWFATAWFYWTPSFPRIPNQLIFEEIE
jgi:hypothetical protein